MSQKDSNSLKITQFPTVDKAKHVRQLDIVIVATVSLLFALFSWQYCQLVPIPSTGSAITNPDEAAHIANALAYKFGKIPIFKAGNPNFEAHQPPLYYLLASVAVDSSKSNSGAANARLLSIVLGIGLIIAAYFFAVISFPGNSTLIRAIPAFVALLPMNQSLCGSINNDVLLNLLVAIFCVALAVLIRDSSTNLTRNSAFVGILIGLGLLTKTSALVTYPTIVVAIGVLLRHKLLTSAEAIKSAATIFGLSLIMVAPWWIRNNQLYGDPLAQNIFTTAFQNTALTSQMLKIWSPIQYVTTLIIWTFDSFWGVFDSMKLFLPKPIYLALALIGGLSLVGMLIGKKETNRDNQPKHSALIMTLASMLLFTLLAFVKFNVTFFQAQGRYLYTALMPFSAFFTLGLQRLLPEKLRQTPLLETVIIIGLLALDSFAYTYFRGAIS